MVKKIFIKMSASKDIEIFKDGECMITILPDFRTLQADDIHNLLDYHAGDTYSVECMDERNNGHNEEDSALKFFAELIKEITDKLNKFSLNEENNASGELLQ